MRLNDSKHKRIMIMEQISIRERSREKERKSSAERRRKIEQNLNDFTQTMSDVSFRYTGNSSGFRYEHPHSQRYESHQQLEKPKPSEKQSLKQEYDQVLRSPSFKDINLGRDNESRMELNRESIKFSRFGNSGQPAKQQQGKQNKVQEEEITYTDRTGHKELMQKLTPNSIVENESSASAIFFTSQFNEFISKNHISSRQQIQPQKQPQIQEKQPSKIEESAYHNQRPKNQPFASNQGVKFDLPKVYQISDHIPQSNNQINPVPQTFTEEQRKSTLIKNKSGHSLAFSNQSSLKYSLNESNIKEILNKKFTNELIADTHHFDPSSNEDSSLYHHLKLHIIAEKYLSAHQKAFFKELNLFIKTVQFSKKVQKRQKRMYFQAFIVNQELNFQEKVNEIKCDKFLLQKQQQMLYNIFDNIKFNLLTVPRSKIDKATMMGQRRQKQMKQKIFRCLKIAWFDQKVKRQIELYYLSKLFSHFARVIKAEKQHTRNKCLAFYCSNLKRRYFTHLKQGIDKLQSQRMLRDNASWHYSFGLQRKVFDAWKDRLSYKDRYISLAMTTKNTFKETRDQKWLQIKTVDFKQIKYQ